MQPYQPLKDELEQHEPFKEAFHKKKEKKKKKNATLADYTRRKEKADKALAKVTNAIDGLDDLGGDSALLKKLLDGLNTSLQMIDHGAANDYPRAYKELESFKTEAYDLAQKAAKAYTEFIEKPAASVTVSLNGQPVKLHPRSVPGFEELSRDQRTKALAAIGGKITNGKALVDKLMNDPDAMKKLNPDRENVADVMWYLKSMAEGKAGEAFIKGSLTLPDEGYGIRKYFDRCSEVYNRLSSHMKDHQEKEGGSARGMDFYEGEVSFKDDGNIDTDKAKLMLPYGMNTVLIQSFTIDSTNEQRLMLKMETEGARFCGVETTSFGMPKGKDPDKELSTRPDFPSMPKSRPSTDQDMSRTVAHGKNAMMSVVLKKHDDGGLAAFREDLGKGKAKEVLEKAEKQAPYVYKKLNRGDWKTNVNVMYHNLESLSIQDPDFDGTEEVKTLLDRFLALAKDMEQFGNMESRVGGEVALSKGDMK
jgi:hypothetical protein